jgi:hypothetical protein
MHADKGRRLLTQLPRKLAASATKIKPLFIFCYATQLTSCVKALSLNPILLQKFVQRRFDQHVVITRPNSRAGRGITLQFVVTSIRM